MNKLNLKPTSKPIVTYYADIAHKRQANFLTEGNVSPVFGSLLDYCAKAAGYTCNTEHTIKVGKRNIRFDAAILNSSNLRYGVWEAKDSADSLDKEIQKKFASGYPNDNILFQSPDQAVLIQDGRAVMRADITAPQALIDILNAFFSYVKPVYDEWERAVAEFKTRVPEIAQKLDDIIEKEYKKRGAYTSAFDTFHDLCRVSINPNLSKDAVEEMLIQHILTERIFRKVFNNDNFTSQNIIAKEIEKVVYALTSSAWNRAEFLRGLDHFYGAIETTASTISDYNEKQAFLNTVYEQFFQGFSVDVADTHGIVYTPQPIVQFMVRSVEQLLQREFGRSLADSGVHILDPFVGTGNFLLRVMEEIRQINPSALPHKYAHELHCNELMLLPYYIASMNIEHAYYEAMHTYLPFEGICLVDTFELAESRQMGLFTQENLERVERQRKSPLTVIIGNPPYNMGQVNENDNNKNRAYPVIDGRIRETYVKASSASLRNKLYDPYVKAFRWASDRLQDEGIVAYVTNNSFIDNIAFDGMRKHLADEFDAVYVLDLGGNVRKNPKLSGTTHNVFGIQVGVCITFLVRHKADETTRKGQVYYTRMDEWWRRGQKYDELDRFEQWGGVTWQKMNPTKKSLWLTDGMDDDYETFLPLGTKEAKRGDGKAIFGIYSLGIVTSRDVWVYNYSSQSLQSQLELFIKNYNYEVFRYSLEKSKPKDIDSFVNNDPKFISWTDRLKQSLTKLETLQFEPTQIRKSLYRPFCKQSLYFDNLLNQRRYQQHRIFPTPASENENRLICLAGLGAEKPFFSFMTNIIPNLAFVGGGSSTQCFPLYVYDADGTNRRDNISDWALGEYRAQYGDDSISKSDIFYSIYALLHHPVYREKYAQNLKRELPRVPMVKNNPHPLTPSPQSEEGEQSGHGGYGFSLPPFDGGRVGDGGQSLPQSGDGAKHPHPLTPSPQSEEGEQSSHGEHGFSLPPFDGGRVGDGGQSSRIPSYTSTEMWEILKPFARQMRQNPTPAEAHLWKFLNKNQILDKRFRRQHPIDRFIVDFYCHEARLVVEVDGDIHEYTQEQDAIRQAFLESLGLRVMRFSNDAVLNDTARVVNEIADAVQNPHPLTPSQLNAGEWIIGNTVFSISPFDEGGMQNNPHPLTPSPQSEEGEQTSHGGHGFSLPPFDGGRVGDGGQSDASAFHRLAKLGRDLSDLHLNYESAPEYPLIAVQNPKVPPSLRVEVMRLNKTKTELVVNESLTLTGIPQRVYDYKLGNRSALEWVIDQYRISEDKRSGIINDPNRQDDAGYIVRLVKQVVHISLETLRLVDEIATIDF